MIELKQYDSTEQLFNETADLCRHELDAALAEGKTSLVVSGGTTPQPLFERLSAMPLAWSEVTVMPSDERWIPADHPASNEKLIRDYLATNKAANIDVLGFKLDFDTPFDAENELNSQLTEHLENCAVAIVGMGLDGHFASLFPGTPQLAEAMDPATASLCSGVDATGCPVAGDYTQRMTLTLSAILKARRVIVLFKGQEKIDLIKSAINDEPASRDLPIYQLLHQSQTAVDICCA